MTKTLQMNFKNADGKTFSISLDAPRDNLTPGEVSAAMDLIIAKNIFATTGGDVIKRASAFIINKDVVELQLV